jgi:hypothetical protein
MKFWKQTILTIGLFSAIAVTFFYSACEKDTCTNVTCLNGGACGNGKCLCPTGFEGSQCATKSVSRFVGVYGGYTTCNNGSAEIDSAFIVADSSGPKFINYVYIKLKSLSTATYPAILHGYVQENESTYSIIVPEEMMSSYTRSYAITLQSNKTLQIATFENYEPTPGDTIINKCAFLGVDTASH